MHKTTEVTLHKTTEVTLHKTTTAGATEHVTIPRHMRAYIYRWCVCALNARQYATLPRLTPTERHVVMYDVWVFPAHPSLCAALPDLTAAVLSNFVTAAVPNGR